MRAAKRFAPFLPSRGLPAAPQLCAAHVRYPVIVSTTPTRSARPHSTGRPSSSPARRPASCSPTTFYVRLNEWATQHVIDEAASPTSRKTCSASKESIQQLGLDGLRRDQPRSRSPRWAASTEAYEGWGYEDIDFARRCAALWPLRRVSGRSTSLARRRRSDDSPLDSDTAQVRANFCAGAATQLIDCLSSRRTGRPSSTCCCARSSVTP